MAHEASSFDLDFDLEAPAPDTLETSSMDTSPSFEGYDPSFLQAYFLEVHPLMDLIPYVPLASVESRERKNQRKKNAKCGLSVFD